MRFSWDPDKDRRNRQKHGVSFEEASRLFTGRHDFLEIYDLEHSQDEDRFVAVGFIDRGVVVVAYTEKEEGAIRIFSARMATAKERRLFHRHRVDRHG